MAHYRKLFLLQFLCIGLIGSIVTCYASNNIFLPGGREAGLAGSGVTLGGLWSVYHNPAGMALARNYIFGFSYENRFFLPELNVASCAGIIPSDKGAFGLSTSYFGGKTYNEQKYALGYAHALSEKLFAGVLFDFFGTHLPGEYESLFSLAGELGVIARPTENLDVGFHIYNLTGSKYKAYSREELNRVFRSGITWHDNYFLLTSLVQVGNKQETIFSIGTEITCLKSISFRFGASNHEPARYSFGFGYLSGTVCADMAFAYHPVLGLTSSISFQMQLSKN